MMAPSMEVPPAVQELLTKNQTVFQEPKTLPPHRALDHYSSGT